MFLAGEGMYGVVVNGGWVVCVRRMVAGEWWWLVHGWLVWVCVRECVCVSESLYVCVNVCVMECARVCVNTRVCESV